MNNQIEIVKNSKKIMDYFGYWPTFHDDQIVLFEKRGNDLFLNIISEAIPNKKTLIQFVLKKLKKHFNYEIKKCPLIFELTFKKENKKFTKMIIDPIYWDNNSDDISWICKEVECLSVTEEETLLLN